VSKVFVSILNQVHLPSEEPNSSSHLCDRTWPIPMNLSMASMMSRIVRMAGSHAACSETNALVMLQKKPRLSTGGEMKDISRTLPSVNGRRREAHLSGPTNNGCYTHSIQVKVPNHSFVQYLDSMFWCHHDGPLHPKLFVDSKEPDSSTNKSILHGGKNPKESLSGGKLN
jgi:hypothetical protein